MMRLVCVEDGPVLMAVLLWGKMAVCVVCK